MTSHLNGLAIRRMLGPKDWSVPEPYGPDGWSFKHKREPAGIIVTLSDHDATPGVEWLHASIARRDRMPDYDDLVLLHQAVFGDGCWSYQVFAPRSEHVNIHPQALHLWGRLDGQSVLPEFGMTLPNGMRSI